MKDVFEVLRDYIIHEISRLPSMKRGLRTHHTGKISPHSTKWLRTFEESSSRLQTRRDLIGVGFEFVATSSVSHSNPPGTNEEVAASDLSYNGAFLRVQSSVIPSSRSNSK